MAEAAPAEEKEVAPVQTVAPVEAAPADAVSAPTPAPAEHLTDVAKSAVESHGLSTGALAGIGGAAGLTALGGGVAALLATHHDAFVRRAYILNSIICRFHTLLILAVKWIYIWFRGNSCCWSRCSGKRCGTSSHRGIHCLLHWK